MTKLFVEGVPMDAEAYDKEEMLTLAKAAKWAGKSPRTLKRWVDRGILKGHKQGVHKTAPFLVSKQELRNHLVTTASACLGHDEAPAYAIAEAPTKGAQGETQGAYDDVKTLYERLLSEVSNERDRLRSEIGQLRNDLADLRDLTDELREAKTVLELELIRRRGIRGLLTSMFTRRSLELDAKLPKPKKTVLSTPILPDLHTLHSIELT